MLIVERLGQCLAYSKCLLNISLFDRLPFQTIHVCVNKIRASDISFLLPEAKSNEENDAFKD